MAEFKNQRIVPIETGELKGSVTIPIILSDNDLGIYLEESAKQRDAEDNPTELAIHLHHQSKKHMVKAIDFPGLTIKNFQNGDRPFPAVMHQYVKHLDPIIRDALNLPNS